MVSCAQHIWCKNFFCFLFFFFVCVSLLNINQIYDHSFIMLIDHHFFFLYCQNYRSATLPHPSHSFAILVHSDSVSTKVHISFTIKILLKAFEFSQLAFLLVHLHGALAIRLKMTRPRPSASNKAKDSGFDEGALTEFWPSNYWPSSPSLSLSSFSVNARALQFAEEDLWYYQSKSAPVTIQR